MISEKSLLVTFFEFYSFASLKSYFSFSFFLFTALNKHLHVKSHLFIHFIFSSSNVFESMMIYRFKRKFNLLSMLCINGYFIIYFIVSSCTDFIATVTEIKKKKKRKKERKKNCPSLNHFKIRFSKIQKQAFSNQ